MVWRKHFFGCIFLEETSGFVRGYLEKDATFFCWYLEKTTFFGGIYLERTTGYVGYISLCHTQRINATDIIYPRICHKGQPFIGDRYLPYMDPTGSLNMIPMKFLTILLTTADTHFQVISMDQLFLCILQQTNTP